MSEEAKIVSSRLVVAQPRHHVILKPLDADSDAEILDAEFMLRAGLDTSATDRMLIPFLFVLSYLGGLAFLAWLHYKLVNPS